MARKITLSSDIPDNIFRGAGEIMLLFGAVDWLIGNILLLSEIGSDNYEKEKDLKVTQKYFEVLLSMKFSRKIERLKELGHDTSQLKILGNYRNTLAHCLIYNSESEFSMIQVAKPEEDRKELSISKIQENIELLKIEGGKLLDFLESKGFSYIVPTVLGHRIK